MITGFVRCKSVSWTGNYATRSRCIIARDAERI